MVWCCSHPLVTCPGWGGLGHPPGFWVQPQHPQAKPDAKPSGKAVSTSEHCMGWSLNHLKSSKNPSPPKKNHPSPAGSPMGGSQSSRWRGTRSIPATAAPPRAKHRSEGRGQRAEQPPAHHGPSFTPVLKFGPLQALQVPQLCPHPYFGWKPPAIPNRGSGSRAARSQSRLCCLPCIFPRKPIVSSSVRCKNSLRLLIIFCFKRKHP